MGGQVSCGLSRGFHCPSPSRDVANPHRVFSSPPHLALGGTMEDRVLMHSLKVFHDVIWTQNPAHLDQNTVSEGRGARGSLS